MLTKTPESGRLTTEFNDLSLDPGQYRGLGPQPKGRGRVVATSISVDQRSWDTGSSGQDGGETTSSSSPVVPKRKCSDG